MKKNRSKRVGMAMERTVAAALMSLGAVVVRAKGSWGLADLVVEHDGKVHFVEVKAWVKTIGQLGRLKALAKKLWWEEERVLKSLEVVFLVVGSESRLVVADHGELGALRCSAKCPLLTYFRTLTRSDQA